MGAKLPFLAAFLVLRILANIVCPGCDSGGTPSAEDHLASAPLGNQDTEHASTTGAPATAELNRRVVVEVSKQRDAAARNELLGLVGVLQATFGEPEVAWSTIIKMDQAPAKEQALGQLTTFQLWIANIRAAEGDYAGGRKAYTFARRAVESLRLGGHGGGDMIISIVKETSPEQWESNARLAGGDRARGLQAALQIADPGQKARALLEIAKALSIAGDISQAKEALTHIEPKREKWQALQAIAIAQNRAGDIEGAKDSIRQIEEIMNEAAGDDPKREAYFSRQPALALAALASAQRKAGDVEGAKRSLSAAHEAAGEIQTYQVGSLLRDMTRTQLEFQDRAGARQTFAFWENLLRKRQQESNQPFGQSNESFKTLTIALADAGHLDDAARVAGTAGQPMVSDGPPPSSSSAKSSGGAGPPPGPEGAPSQEGAATIKYDEDAVAAIVRQQLSRGDTKGALETLDKIADTARGKDLRNKIVTELLKSHDYDAVLKVAEKIPDADTRFWLLIRGDVVAQVPGAMAVALKSARQIPDMPVPDRPGMKNSQARDNAVRWVVEAQARAGDLEQARATLKEIQDGSERGIAVASIAKAEGGGKDSRTANASSQAQTATEPDFVASFAAARTLGDWQGNQELQRQVWSKVSVAVDNGDLVDAQRILRKLVELAAQQFRSWAVNAQSKAPQTPKG